MEDWLLAVVGGVAFIILIVGIPFMCTRHGARARSATGSNAALVGFSESAGVWKGERRPFGIVLTRGFGELLVVTESTSSPGEFHVKYDAPFKEGSAVPE